MRYHSSYALDERIRVGTPMFVGDVGRLYLMMQEALVFMGKLHDASSDEDRRTLESFLDGVSMDIYFALTGNEIKIVSRRSYEG